MKQFILPLAVALVLCLGLLLWFSGFRKPDASAKEWREYLGGPDRNHYSALTQINRENVARLEMAWQYHTGDTGQNQCNPLLVNGTLYGMTARELPFAPNAPTGAATWNQYADEASNLSIRRGLAHWDDVHD